MPPKYDGRIPSDRRVSGTQQVSCNYYPPTPSVWKSHSITSNLSALSLQREEGGGIPGNDVTDRSL